MTEYFHLQCPKCLRTVRMDELPYDERYVFGLSDELCYYCQKEKDEEDDDYYYDD